MLAVLLLLVVHWRAESRHIAVPGHRTCPARLLEKARQFTQSPDLKEAMQKAGVTGPPEIIFLEAVG